MQFIRLNRQYIYVTTMNRYSPWFIFCSFQLTIQSIIDKATPRIVSSNDHYESSYATTLFKAICVVPHNAIDALFIGDPFSASFSAVF